MFGFDYETDKYEEMELSAELQNLWICAYQTANNPIHANFRGFTFQEYGSDTKKRLQSSCAHTRQNLFDLTRSRLIGFRVIISDFWQGKQNIRAICPILDTPDCADTEFMLSNTRDMSVEIGTGYDSQIISHDSLSKFYFEQDGYSFCGSRTVALSPTPSYVSVSDSTEPAIIVQSSHYLDPIITNLITATVTLDNEPAASASITFNVGLVCP